MNFWQGEKVKLRAIEPTDADVFFQWNLDSERARNLDFVWPPTSIASVKAWVAEQSQKKLENDAFHWIIATLDELPVGSISTHRCDSKNRTFSYGVDIAPDHQGKGYASEAIEIVLKYYFEELGYQKVTIPVHSHNEASIRLHEKLGFQREGTIRRMVFTRGRYYDLLWFGMTVEEFQGGGADR